MYDVDLMKSLVFNKNDRLTPNKIENIWTRDIRFKYCKYTYEIDQLCVCILIYKSQIRCKLYLKNHIWFTRV